MDDLTRQIREGIVGNQIKIEDRIQKSLGNSDWMEDALNGNDFVAEEIQKARSGVYANTAENRKKGRVGQKFGGSSEKKEEEPNHKETTNDTPEKLHEKYMSGIKEKLDKLSRVEPKNIIEWMGERSEFDQKKDESHKDLIISYIKDRF